MADSWPAYERPTFKSVDLADVGDRSALEAALGRAFEHYREFTRQLLTWQQKWVATVQESEDSQFPPGAFKEFETEPCMNDSPVDEQMECIDPEISPLYVYLTVEAAEACARNQRLEDIPDTLGEDEVMALTTPPYTWTSTTANSIKRKYHKRGYDMVTRGDIKHFIAISSTDCFEHEDGTIWTHPKDGRRFDIVAYGRASTQHIRSRSRRRRDREARLRTIVTRSSQPAEGQPKQSAPMRNRSKPLTINDLQTLGPTTRAPRPRDAESSRHR
ncbi:hypothetical protein AYJ54_17740 [Bradyrhizobium centrolobii]|uniref:Cytokinin glycosidase domain-containing protein n=1 Tax=Bradyrhizobium centrolobii TaxID=1505087 RepID=A0A176YKA5_9BRAD|nr:hypothetical protein AYJ54_17740 [Bradyrhizobium centrolobii]